ncbi:UNVERIFIED_CONTAM: hypothetical protein Sindi_1656800, partial [Sesamum indicum]
MSRLDSSATPKSIHELINMLVQYEAMTHKSAPAVLIGEASTSKAKSKRVGRWKRKEGKEKVVTATPSAPSVPVAPVGKDKEKGKNNGLQQSRAHDVYIHCREKRGIGRGSAHNSSPTQVLERDRRLRKDEMVLRLGDGKAVAAEAIGSVNLAISDH